MTVEIRNFSPANSEDYVPNYTDIQFDLVGLDGKLVDISTLSVTVETTSNVDTSTHTVDYTTSDTTVVRYWGDSSWYKVIVSPDRPFDLEITATIKVNIDDTDGGSMTEYESSFIVVNLPLVKNFRYAFLDLAERIPVYNEQLRKNSDTSPTEFKSAFDKWNKNPSPIIRQNQAIIGSGYTIDHNNGNIIFSTAREYNDSVDASYTFSFFTDDQIESYFDRAASIYLISPPFSGPSTIYAGTETTQYLIMIGAANFAFRDLMFSLAFQETRLIFDNASWEEGWIQVKELFKGLSESYAKDWEVILTAKKVKLPSIGSVVIPEYTLPGGRSRFFRYLYKEGSTF